MPVVVSAKVSADANNAVRFGADAGLSLPAPYGTSGGVNQLYMIDNSWAAAGQSMAYTLPGTSIGAALALPLGSALLMPFSVATRARPTAAQLWVSTAGTSVYCSVFATDAAGFVGGKLSDLLMIDTSATGLRAAASMLDPNFVFGGRARYWLAWWSYGTATNVWQVMDVNASTLQPGRLTTPPVTGVFTQNNSNRGFTDATNAWGSLRAAPATVAFTAPSGTTVGTRMPMAWWMLTNL